MATIFELAMWGKPDSYLQSVAEEVFEEIRRIELQLSIYRADAELYEVNALAAERAIPLDPRVYQLLKRAVALSRQTNGAFDFTIGPLVKAWGFYGGSGQPANSDAVDRARSIVGVDHLIFDDQYRTIRFDQQGVTLDLGAIGKGYAIDMAAELIRDMEIPGALLHGGTSTVYAIGARENGTPWKIAVQDPSDESAALTEVELRDCSLSVSAIHGKFFEDEGVRFGHVLDPRSGQPVQKAILAAIVCDSAEESDALSTALLVDGLQFLDLLSQIRPLARGLVVVPNYGQFVTHNCLAI